VLLRSVIVEGLGKTVAGIAIGGVLLLQHVAQLVEAVCSCVGIGRGVVMPANAFIPDR